MSERNDYTRAAICPKCLKDTKVHGFEYDIDYLGACLNCKAILVFDQNIIRLWEGIKEQKESSVIYTADQLSLYAKQAIENPIINQVLEALRTNALEKFEASEARASEDREKLYWFLKALTEFKGQLRLYLIDEEKKKDNPEDKFNYA